MRLILSLLFLSLTALCFAASEAVNKAKMVDGVMQFPVCKTGDKYFYSQGEAESHFSIAPSSAEVNQKILSFTETELTISSCVYNIYSRDEFNECLTKKGLAKKLSQMRDEYNVSIDLNDSDKIMRYKRLLEIYQTLP